MNNKEYEALLAKHRGAKALHDSIKNLEGLIRAMTRKLKPNPPYHDGKTFSVSVRRSCDHRHDEGWFGTVSDSTVRVMLPALKAHLNELRQQFQAFE